MKKQQNILSQRLVPRCIQAVVGLIVLDVLLLLLLPKIGRVITLVCIAAINAFLVWWWLRGVREEVDTPLEETAGLAGTQRRRRSRRYG